MNKKIIIVIIAVVAILAVIVGAVVLNNNDNNEMSANDENNTTLSNNEELSSNKENITENNNEQNGNLANTDKKILIAYFSYSGNTEIAAKEIQNQVGGDLFEINRKEEYSSSNLSDEAQDEIENNQRPELAEQVTNMEEYDVVFVGYPVWWHRAPAVINSFLESYDLSGKTVIPFCTSASSDIDETLESFNSSCNSNNILEGITISGSSANSNSGKEKIRNWITSLDL